MVDASKKDYNYRKIFEFILMLRLIFEIQAVSFRFKQTLSYPTMGWNLENELLSK